MPNVVALIFSYVGLLTGGSTFIKGMGSETIEGNVAKLAIITEFAIRQLAFDACKRFDYQELSELCWPNSTDINFTMMDGSSTN